MNSLIIAACNDVPIGAIGIACCVVHQIGGSSHAEMFQRQLFVLRAKASEVPTRDDWAGKVMAIVKRVDSRADGVDEKLEVMRANYTNLEANQAILAAKVDKMNESLEQILAVLSR